MKHERLAAVCFAALIVVGLAASAGAVDGTIEINQTKVMAGGGFPYKITASGSYRLTGNLTVSSTTADAIDVSSDNVTIDLNGFTISGAGISGGAGINTANNQVDVENGAITAFNVGVTVGGNSIVRGVRAHNNGTGINAGANAVIERCTASSNTVGDGIRCAGACVISSNTANANAVGIFCFGNGCTISGNTVTSSSLADGIACEGNACVISGNTVTGNTNNGIDIFSSSAGLIVHNAISDNAIHGITASDATSAYGENVLNNNSGGNVSGGTSLKNNLCSGTVC